MMQAYISKLATTNSCTISSQRTVLRDFVSVNAAPASRDNRRAKPAEVGKVSQSKKTNDKPARNKPQGRPSGAHKKARKGTETSKVAAETNVADSIEVTGTNMCWRVFQIAVPYSADPGKDDLSVSEALRLSVVKRLGCKPSLPASAIHLVRKSFDSRKPVRGVRSEKQWVYVLDVDTDAVRAAGGHKLAVAQGQLELVSKEQPLPLQVPTHAAETLSTATLDIPATLVSHASSGAAAGGNSGTADLVVPSVKSAHPVVVIGSGPAGLFAALTAAQAGLPVLLLERGQPVEQRGKDIGALLVRGILSPDSNLCYGEGGAGTWSDGKLATKIGRNSDPVRAVLQALVDFGAPEGILVTGKPHLGTDRLVRILKEMREHLLALGAQIRFGTSVEDVEISNGRVTGVKLAGSGEIIKASSVVLAVGHSARSMYRRLVAKDVCITPKPFAMGFRIEHPQTLIDEGRYGTKDAADVQRGKGRIPVADYKLNVEVADDDYASRNPVLASSSEHSMHSAAVPPPAAGHAQRVAGSDPESQATGQNEGQEQKRKENKDKGIEEYGGNSGRSVPDGTRAVFSFCMCPGGQIVCTSTKPEELCLNGMSFSRRNSQWANSALVVNVGPKDWDHHLRQHGVLAGVAFQEEIEREAARRGGGNLVAPVQRVVDYVAEEVSTGELPSSSYRLGVKSAALHDIYPPFVSLAVQKALQRFDRSIPGFASSPQALLHGCETRTSAPVRIDRDPDTLQCLSIAGLYPSGEGAGYAGGIVSAAVDGLKVGQAIVKDLLAHESARGQEMTAMP